MSISRIKFENFTTFKELEIQSSPGINIFIGENGTGKTHILKAAYAACDISKSGETFARKLKSVFMPSGNQLGRLVSRQVGTQSANIEITRSSQTLQFSFSTRTETENATKINGLEKWMANRVESVYIPVKEMLANAPGFRSLYNSREVHFEEIYADILDRAYIPPKKGAATVDRRNLMSILEQVLEGKVEIHGEEFFHKSKRQNASLEFSLLAEGMRKLGLLWILIQNGSLLNGSILFWDEPEANLNPKIMKTVVELLLELQRAGVQVFIATHDYVTLKTFDLQTEKSDQVLYHALYRDEKTREIQIQSSDSYLQLDPNCILDTFGELYDQDIARALQ